LHIGGEHLGVSILRAHDARIDLLFEPPEDLERSLLKRQSKSFTCGRIRPQPDISAGEHGLTIVNPRSDLSIRSAIEAHPSDPTVGLSIQVPGVASG
jgi:hypothetical protein